MQHVLKIWPEHFHSVMLGQKKVELRKNDRGYQVGDKLVLRCWDPETKQYTGSWITVEVTHIDRGQPWLSEGYVALSIRR